MQKLSIAWYGGCATEHPVVQDWHLYEFAKKYGMELVPLRDSSKEVLIEINFSMHKSLANMRGVGRKKLILFSLEPQVVLPIQYKKPVRKMFGKVFVTSPLQRVLQSDESFDFGLLSDNMVVSAPDFHNRTNAVGILNANKTSWVSGSHYGTRKDWINNILRAGYPVHVGGKDWDANPAAELKMNIVALMSCIAQGELPDLGVYRPPLDTAKNPLLKLHGEIQDGINFLGNYKFCLVIENDSRYLSEKLFQALVAGCVPLYCGPRLLDFGVPEGIALDLNDKRAQNLTAYLTNSEMHSRVLAAGKSFLSDERLKEYWSHQSGLDRLFQRIRWYLDQP